MQNTEELVTGIQAAFGDLSALTSLKKRLDDAQHSIQSYSAKTYNIQKSSLESNLFEPRHGL